LEIVRYTKDAYYVTNKMNLELEKETVERARKDSQAFGELYEQYYSPIFAYILKRTASLEASQDICSEVFFKAFHNLGQFHWRDVPFSSWLYRIANNEIANHYRKKGQQLSSLKEVFYSTPFTDTAADSEMIEAEAELMKQEEFLTLHAGISRLPLKYQEVITLRFFQDKQLKEIAEILGKREGTVKSLLHRGLAKLRELMEQNATFQ
jgi:RNA polymerase sigma factor (sigma-70 family)